MFLRVFYSDEQGLNDRFAMFIDKVRHLEQQNKVLEVELVTLRQRQGEPSRVAHLDQQELRDLRTQVEELSRDNNRILVQRNNMEDELRVELRGREGRGDELLAFPCWAPSSPNRLMSHFRSSV